MILGQGVALNTAALNQTGEITHPQERAGLTKGALNTLALNTVTTSYTLETGAVGVTRVYNSFEVYAVGRHSLAVFPVELFGSGLHRCFNDFSPETHGSFKLGKLSFSACGGGLYSIANSLEIAASGRSELYNNFINDSPGAYGIAFATFELHGSGFFMSGYESFSLETPGYCVLHGYSSFEVLARGQFKYNLLFSLHGSGLSRVANDLTRYELYCGVDGLVDFSAPWQIFNSLPFACPALDPDHEYRFVLRKRNDYNLQSQNVEEWTLVVDDAGAVDFVAPSGPLFSIASSAGGRMFISGLYDYPVDGDNQADQWLIYLTDSGIDPDPETDTPIIVNMAKSDGMAKLNYMTDSFANDVVIRTLVRVRRSGGPVDSLNNNIISGVADSAGPTAPRAEVFY